MNRIQRIYRSIKSFFNDIKATYSVDLTGGNVKKITEAEALNIGAVFRCLNLIAGDISNLEKNVVEVASGNNIESDYSVLLNRIAYNNVTAVQFFKEMILSALINGNALALKVETGALVTGLQMLYPDDYEITLNDKDEIVYKVNGKVLDGSKVVHFHFFSLNGLWGESVLKFAEKTTAGAFAADRAAERILNRGGIMANYLTMQNPVNPEKAETMSVKFTQKLLNPLDKGYPILGDGIDLKSATVNTKDIQLMESRRYSVEDVCRFLGVPPILVFSEGQSAAAIEGAREIYLTNCLTHIITCIEQELTLKLFPLEEVDVAIRFDTFPLKLAAVNDKAAYIRCLLELGLLNRNEARKYLGFGNISLGETYYITGQLRPDTLAETGFDTSLDNNANPS